MATLQPEVATEVQTLAEDVPDVPAVVDLVLASGEPVTSPSPLPISLEHVPISIEHTVVEQAAEELLPEMHSSRPIPEQTEVAQPASPPEPAEELLPEIHNSRPIPEETEVAQPVSPREPPESPAAESVRAPEEESVRAPEEESVRASPVPSVSQPASAVSTAAPPSKEASMRSITAPATANEVTDMTAIEPDNEITVLPAPEMPEEPAVFSAERSSLNQTTTAPAATPRAPVEAPADPEIKEVDEQFDVQPAPETTAGPSPAILNATESLTLKTLPKVAAEAAVQAGQAYVVAGKEARVTLKDLLSLRDKEGPPVTLTVDQIVTALFLVLVGFQLLLMPIFMPSTFRLVYSLLWGLGVGLSISYLFYFNRKKKREVNELLSVNLGLKGVQFVTAGVPAMYNGSDTEKMEWLNALVVELWPFIDKGVCEIIKDTTSQMMPGILQSLPAAIAGIVKSVGFKHLTFGAAPFRVESIWVSPNSSAGLVMELSIKWCGDPNITLAIEIATGQKLCPRIMDISFVATVRLVLSPLVDRLPGFVAAMATVPKSPLIKYRLDFGKALGGSVAPAAVTPVINYFIRDTIDRMLVWPARLVVPIIQETQQDIVEVQRLLRRIRGVLRVCVVQGKEFKGVEPADEVCIQATTDSEYYASTSRKAAVVLLEGQELKDLKLDKVEPVKWNDFMYLLVQEPDSQMMRMEAYDLTAVRAGKLLTVSGRRLVGRSLVKLNKICAAAMKGETEPIPVRIQFGGNDWGSPGGPGKGAGKVLLQMTYLPCDKITKEQVLAAEKGIVTFRMAGLRGLTSTTGSITAYASVNTTVGKRDGKPAWRTSRKTWTLAAQTNALKARIAKLSAGRERDIRDGKLEEAAKTALLLETLSQELNGENATTPSVSLDFTMDGYSLHAFYDITEKVDDTDEDNKLIIKVTVDGGGRKSAPAVGVAEVSIAEIRNSCDRNPMSMNMEHGLHLRNWDGWNGADPRNSSAAAVGTELGVPLDGLNGARLWAVMRWIPCIDAFAAVPDDEEEFEKTKPSMFDPLPSVFQHDTPSL